MKKNIEDILKELIALEPSFAAHETQMRTLITEFLQKKPDTHLDEEFVARLRSQLLGAPTPSPFSYASFFSPRYLVLGVLAVLLIAPLGFYASKQGVGQSTGSAVFAMNQQIQHLQGDAYGQLQAQAGGLGGGARNAASNPEVATMSTASAGFAPGATSDAKMMIPNGPVTVYSYVYKGDPLELSDTDGTVYRHTIGQNSSGQIATQLKKFNFGLMNLNAFSDMSVRTFELAENKPFGYTIDVNFNEGTISVNADYTQWPSLSGKNGAIEQLPKSAMPANDEVLAIAKKFLDDHDISLTNYGDPVVQEYSNIAASEMQFAPEQITVTYPLKIEGTSVYEDGAYPYGLQVGVSVRDKKVMSVYGLTSQTYTSSSYKLETDSSKILSVLDKGGPHAWVPQESEGVQIKKVEVEVGTPQKVLLHTYSYSNGDSQELFVPALSFPVTKAPEDEQYYPKNIIVPLVPELLNETQGGPVLYDAVR